MEEEIMDDILNVYGTRVSKGNLVLQWSKIKISWILVLKKVFVDNNSIEV